MIKKWLSRPTILQIEDRVSIPIWEKIDFPLVFSTLLLILIGLSAIYSSTLNLQSVSSNYIKQIVWIGISFTLAVFIYFIPLKYFNFFAYPLYAITLIALLVVVVIGKTIYGSQSWFRYGILGFQPSEFAKLATILALANFLSNKKVNINNFKHFSIAVGFVLLPFLLIMLQPDLGTGLLFISIFLFAIFWHGLSAFTVFVLVSPAVVGIASLFGVTVSIATIILVIIGLIYFKRDIFISVGVFILNLASVFLVDYLLHILSPHQLRRIENFLNPMHDPLGSGYNALQAKVAVGSGGIFGKGFLEGSQTQLKFIPEQWTDFIFCVIGEEFGFIGSIFVLTLFFIIVMRLLRIANQSKSEFRSNVVIMTIGMFLTHIFINIGMTLGVVPVIGIPLPFLSYGGSSLITNVSLIAIALNFYKNRTSFI